MTLKDELPFIYLATGQKTKIVAVNVRLSNFTNGCPPGAKRRTKKTAGQRRGFWEILGFFSPLI